MRSAAERPEHQKFPHFDGLTGFARRPGRFRIDLHIGQALFDRARGERPPGQKPVKLRGRKIEIARDLLELGAICVFQLGWSFEFGGNGTHPAPDNAGARYPSHIGRYHRHRMASQGLPRPKPIPATNALTCVKPAKRQTALLKHAAASTRVCGSNTAAVTPTTGRPASVAVTPEAVRPMGSSRFQNGLRLALFCTDI